MRSGKNSLKPNAASPVLASSVSKSSPDGFQWITPALEDEIVRPRWALARMLFKESSIADCAALFDAFQYRTLVGLHVLDRYLIIDPASQERALQPLGLPPNLRRAARQAGVLSSLRRAVLFSAQ